MKCRTPEIPPECRLDTDGKDEDEIDEEEEVEQEDNNDNGQTSSHTGSACTVGKGPKSAKGVQHKLSSVQHVESNRKEIVDAEKKLKTLRAIKDEKKVGDKKKDAFFFIHMEASVDNCVHWEELNCGVITDDHDSEENCTISKTSKV